MRRGAAPAAALGYAIVIALLVAASARSDRYPHPGLYAVALFGPPLGAGLIGRSWWLLALAPLPGVLGVALVFLADNPWLPLAFGWFSSIASLVVLPVGIAVGRRAGRPARLAAAGGVVLVSGLLVIPVAVWERGRDVQVDRPRPLAIDERAGTFRGVGLGDSLAAVRRALGRGNRVPADDPRSRGVGPPAVTTGPSYLPATSDEVYYGRDFAFLLDSDRRVEFVEVADRRARTRAGVGPGDSLERFRRAYPAMRCEEGSLGSDEPDPYPACSVRVGDERWLYVSGTYDRPGEPAVVLILSRRRIQP